MKPKNVVDPLTQIIFVDIDVLSALGLNEHDASVVLITPELPSSGICQDMAKIWPKPWENPGQVVGLFWDALEVRWDLSSMCPVPAGLSSCTSLPALFLTRLRPRDFETAAGCCTFTPGD